MSEYTTKKLFSAKVRSIKAGTTKLRDDIQDALVAAFYLTLKDHNTEPFNQILDAVGSAVHRQGISMWAELNAPVRIVKDRFLLNAVAFKAMDADGILADFDAHLTESGMFDQKWWLVAKKQNTTDSVWDFDSSVARLIKRLETDADNAQPELARTLREAYDTFMANAAKAALAPAEQ